jgi:acyl CoA:acetate/3-ketoacid CoA transferase
MNYFQTGDLLYIETTELPKKLTAIKSGVILHSDTTGHSHVVHNAKLFKNTDGKMFIQVPKLAKLTHEEHKDLKLPKGNYEIRIVQEFDHAENEARSVID